MASVDLTFQTNKQRGCSELFIGEFRVVASVNTEFQAVDFEIELEHEGVWTTLYFERTVISESLSCPGTRRVVRRTLAEVALKKIQAIVNAWLWGNGCTPCKGSIPSLNGV